MSENDVKEQALCDTLSSLGSVIVAYSGGVDSAYLALGAQRTLGARALAVTADSPSNPER
ncbi:MAG: TIGR00268 family protein, partial [Acidobacteria bacterium]|nr:TIGR00268 family protein [Acidobacteriota bacterium]